MYPAILRKVIVQERETVRYNTGRLYGQRFAFVSSKLTVLAEKGESMNMRAHAISLYCVKGRRTSTRQWSINLPIKPFGIVAYAFKLLKDKYLETVVSL